MRISKQNYLQVLALFLLLSITVPACGQNSSGVVQVGTEAREMKSGINGVQYKFLINLPASYYQNTSKTYPVCYVLDGQWSFTNVVSNYWDLQYDGMLPEIIIVGLTYAGPDPNYESLRIHDYTPVPILQFPGSGAAAEYVEILRKEVIPFIDKTYRTNKTDRSLTGNSAAGLFCHYVMFNAPELFNGYIPINPSLWWGNEKVFECEETFAKANKKLNARVFMVSGEFDNVPPFEKMVSRIRSRGYEGLLLESRILEGMGHSGSKSEGHARGLKYIYQRERVKLPDTELKQYEGKYQVTPDLQVTLVAKDGGLLITGSPGMPDQHIFAVNEKEFSLNGTYFELRFIRDNQGKVVAASIGGPGNRSQEIKKID